MYLKYQIEFIISVFLYDYNNIDYVSIFIQLITETGLQGLFGLLCPSEYRLNS
jgi:hypothetical protein